VNPLQFRTATDPLDRKKMEKYALCLDHEGPRAHEGLVIRLTSLLVAQRRARTDVRGETPSLHFLGGRH